MGKPESTLPRGQSVNELMLSIRKAIEADGVQIGPASNDVPRHMNVPMAPRVHDMPAAAPDRTYPAAPAAEQLSDQREAESDGEPYRGPGYISSNPYRYRHSLGSSPTYMSLRNRLASLNSRTRSDSRRSFASLLGGDVREEEARARAHTGEPHAGPAEAPQPDGLLRSTVVDEEAHVGEFVANELASSAVSYSPDYHEWSLENSLDDFGYRPGASAVADSAFVAEQEAAVEQEVEFVAEADPDAPLAVVDEPEADEAPPQEDTLPLEAMIRQVIEPELAHWFDVHLPDHVAAAMPGEDAFIHMIRPLIEDWLSDNLEPIVDKAVREEIARITGLKR